MENDFHFERESIGWTIFRYLAISIFFIIPITIFAYSTSIWPDLTPCFQRELLILNIFAIYMVYVKPYYANTIIEIFQFTSIFWIAEFYNQNQLEKYDGCLFIGEDLALYIIDAAFKVGLISYTISCACFLLFCVGVLLYLVVEHFYIGDRRRRPREKLKIEDLETIKFSLKDSSTIQGQHLCSICLVEFEDKEDVVRTPICNHYFHHECLKKWINTHDECPYCRANIRQNLKQKNDLQSQRTMRDVSVNPNEYQLNQSFELQPNSNIQPH